MALAALAISFGIGWSSLALAQSDELPPADEIRSLIVAEGLTLWDVAGRFGVSAFEVGEALGVPVDRASLGYFWPTCLDTYIEIMGTAGDLGFTRAGVRDELVFRLRNDMSYMPMCNEDRDAFDEDLMEVRISVWTVGETSPIALHVELGTYIADYLTETLPDSWNEPFARALLGYGTDGTVGDQVNEAIQELVRELSMDYLDNVN